MENTNVRRRPAKKRKSQKRAMRIFRRSLLVFFTVVALVVFGLCMRSGRAVLEATNREWQ